MIPDDTLMTGPVVHAAWGIWHGAGVRSYV
jgi:hypothetical protein